MYLLIQQKANNNGYYIENEYEVDKLNKEQLNKFLELNEIMNLGQKYFVFKLEDAIKIK